MVFGELMMIEIVERGIVNMTHVDHTSPGIRKIRRGRFASHHGHWVERKQNAAREDFVFVGAARMSKNGMDGRHQDAAWMSGSRRRTRDAMAISK
jgi:hypothetical protein